MVAISGDPGAAAARARVETLLERLTRVDLQVVVVAPPDGMRLAARNRARDAAIAAGRNGLLDEATAAAGEMTLRAFARAGFSGTWAATDMSASVARASDRVAAAAAFEEAATAAVVEDLVDDDTLEVLRSSSNELDRATGMPPPGSLSALAQPAASAMLAPFQVAIVIAFVIVCAAIWLVSGTSPGLVVLAFGLVTVAGLARRRIRPGS